MKVALLLFAMVVFFWSLSIGIALAIRGAVWVTLDVEPFALGAGVALVLMAIFMWISDKIVEG